MRPSRHFVVSVSLVAAVWFFTKSVYAAVLCFVSGFLMDLDHVLEYIIHYGWKAFNIKKLYLACEQTPKQEGELAFRKLYFVFHAAEFMLVLWVLTIFLRNKYILALTLGYSAHLVMDYIGNSAHLKFYFISWRALNSFDAECSFRKNA
jgi:hypothetical protein